MKDLFLRFCRWALPLLGIMTVISCDGDSPALMYGTLVAEYGTPIMEFRVAGKVTDSHTGEPVKGISVSCDDDWEDPEVITSDDGEFIYESNAFPSDEVLLKFKDIDDEDNGYYIPNELRVKLKQSKPGSGNWHQGLYIAEGVVVKMMEDFPVMYGTPTVGFSVKGKVLDADSNPIPNIEVTHDEWHEPVRTDAAGSFEINAEITGFEMETASLTFTDTDGDENGGEFMTQTVDIPLTQTDPGDGIWDNGDYSANDVKVTLSKKSATV